MKKWLQLLLLSCAYLLVSCDSSVKSVSPTEKEAAVESYYTCAMHPHIHEDKPGKCPICHMNLTKVEVEKKDASAPSVKEAVEPQKLYACAEDHTLTSINPDICPLDGSTMVEISSGPSNEEKVERIVAEVKLRKAQVSHFSPTLFPVGPMMMSDHIRLLGNVVRAEEKESSIPARAPGRVERVYISSTGSMMKIGDPVVDLYSPILISGGDEYLIARREFEKSKSKEYGRLARQGFERLVLLGVMPWQIEEWAKSGKVPNTITLYSQNAGIVSKLAAVKGRYFKEGENLVELSDLSSVWVEMDVYEFESAKVTLGQNVSLKFSSLAGENYTGKIDFISPVVDPMSRTLKIRTTISNPKGSLRPGMEGLAELAIDLGIRNIVIPQSAIIDTGRRKVVWVHREGDSYMAKEIRSGVEASGYVEVLSGLKNDDQVVLEGNFILDAQAQLFGGYRE